MAHGQWTRSAEGVQSTWETGHSPVLVLEGEFGDVIIEVDGAGIRILPVGKSLARAQAIARNFLGDSPDSLVEDLLAERRREAALE